MTLGLAFWIVMLVWFVFGFWQSGWNLKTFAPNFVLLFLLILLGWQVFGAPLHK